MNDLVIGAGYNLTWEQCRVWVNSLNTSGFEGEKILVYFGENHPLFDELNKRGVKVAVFPHLTSAHNVCVSRFGAYHALLASAKQKFNWVIATDVTDVVFQKNPSDFLAERIAASENHVASSENLKYNQEPWGKNNLTLSFGEDQYKFLQNSTIYNAGVIAARHDRMMDISNIIYQLSITRLQHVFGGGGPDQAAYNVLLSMETLNQGTAYLSHDYAWACQCGTTLDPSKPDYAKIGIDPIPTSDGEHIVNSRNNVYTIVHQYNRVPSMKEYFERKYNGN